MSGPTWCFGHLSVSFAIKLILLYHLLANAVFTVMSLGDLAIFNNASHRDTSKYSITVAGYALLGLPVIAFAVWGVFVKSETALRCYFYYLSVSVVVNTAYTVDALVRFAPCASGTVPLEALHPGIFDCGHTRGIALMALAFVVGFQICMPYPVYAYCDDLAWEAEAEQAHRLGKEKLPTRRLAMAARWAALRDTPLQHIQGRMAGEYGSAVEVAACIGSTHGSAMGQSTAPTAPHLPATRLV